MKYLIGLVLLLTGCTSSTLHVGKVDDDAILYWVESDNYELDTNTTILVKTKGSTNVAMFEDEDGSIVFHKRQSDQQDLNGVCGTIQGAKSIRELGDTLSISIWCTNKPNPFNSSNHDYPFIPQPIQVEIKTCSIDDIQISEWECLNGN